MAESFLGVWRLRGLFKSPNFKLTLHHWMDLPCLFWTASLQPDTVRFYSFIWSASTGLSMEKCVNGCLRVCMLSLGTCTQVCTLTKVHKVNLWRGTKLLSLTTDTVSWTEVLKCATIPRHCWDVWTVCCWLTDQSDQASLSVTTPVNSFGELVLGTCVLTVISKNWWHKAELLPSFGRLKKISWSKSVKMWTEHKKI